MSILETAVSLRDLLNADRQMIEKDLVAAGNKHLGFYKDDRFEIHREDFQKVIEQAMQKALLDVSGGAELLKSGQIGVCMRGNAPETFYSIHGERPEGVIVFAVFLKKFKAFQAFRENEADDLDQDVLNLLSYCLIAHWAQLLPRK